MRLLHTADWHLGRSLYGANLIDQQGYLLDQIVDLARQAEPDVVIVAGDVYDRAVPPTEAVNLLDDVLSRLVLGVGLPVILIAGNHDNPDRLAFASRVLMDRGLHILGQPISSTAPVILKDKHGPVHFYPLPYAEPAIVRHCLSRDDIEGHQQAMHCLLEGLWSRHPDGVRAVAVAHCFVTGSTETESERPLSVGGAGAVEPAVFRRFDYVALGHLHRPQAPAADRIRYSGSLMRYSFSESDHDKAVLLVTLDPKGGSQVEEIPLTPRCQVRCIEGKLAEVLNGAANDPHREDYLLVTLRDREPIFDVMGRLREVYPNVLHVERPTLTAQAGTTGDRIDHRKVSALDLFSAFFEQVTGEELTPAGRDAFVGVAETVRRGEREARS
jgi:exonuclease SbcD